jgi:hypothetical protein
MCQCVVWSARYIISTVEMLLCPYVGTERASGVEGTSVAKTTLQDPQLHGYPAEWNGFAKHLFVPIVVFVLSWCINLAKFRGIRSVVVVVRGPARREVFQTPSLFKSDRLYYRTQLPLILPSVAPLTPVFSK